MHQHGNLTDSPFASGLYMFGAHLWCIVCILRCVVSGILQVASYQKWCWGGGSVWPVGEAFQDNWCSCNDRWAAITTEWVWSKIVNKFKTVVQHAQCKISSSISKVEVLFASLDCSMIISLSHKIVCQRNVLITDACCYFRWISIICILSMDGGFVMH